MAVLNLIILSRVFWYLFTAVFVIGEIDGKRNLNFMGKIKNEVHRNWHLVNPPNCGESLLLKSRIIGGRAAELGEFPWIVLLFTSRPGSYKLDIHCAGSIINEKYVVTAAHCFTDKIRVLEFVRAGDYNIATNPDCLNSLCASPYRDYIVEDIFKHKEFHRKGFLRNDITLIRIKEKFIFNDFVAPICLPLPFGKFTEHNYSPGEKLEVVGWGINHQSLDEYGFPINLYPDVLQALSLPVVNREICSLRIEKHVSESQICVGGVAGEDSCSGDSGGPLMGYIYVNNTLYGSIVNSERYFLVGITSFGKSPCAQYSVPGMYTRVDHFIYWLLEHMNE